MNILRSYVEDRWVEGQGGLATLVNPATEEPLARAGTSGIDFGKALEHARARGGPALRAAQAARGACWRSATSR